VAHLLLETLQDARSHRVLVEAIYVFQSAAKAAGIIVRTVSAKHRGGVIETLVVDADETSAREIEAH